MPLEGPNIRPISALPWSEPWGGFLLRAAKSTLAANCCGLAVFGLVLWLSGAPWTAIGSMIFVVAAGGTLALVPSFRLGWRRFAVYWLICAGGSVALAGLTIWTIATLF